MRWLCGVGRQEGTYGLLVWSGRGIRTSLGGGEQKWPVGCAVASTPATLTFWCCTSLLSAEPQPQTPVRIQEAYPLPFLRTHCSLSSHALSLHINIIPKRSPMSFARTSTPLVRPFTAPRAVACPHQFYFSTASRSCARRRFWIMKTLPANLLTDGRIISDLFHMSIIL